MGLSLEELEAQATECLPARDVMSSLGAGNASDLPGDLAALLPGEVSEVTDMAEGTAAPEVPALPAVPEVPGTGGLLPELPGLPGLPTLPGVTLPSL